MVKSVDLFLAFLSAVLLLGWAHAYDWKVIGGRKPSPPWSYVAGVFLMDVPLLGLLAYWRDGWALGAVVAVTIGAGLPVLFGYNIRGQAKRTNHELLVSEHLADEREISANLRRDLMQAEREKAALIARVASLEANHDG